MSVINVVDTLEYQDYINSYLKDEKYSDPHLTAIIETGEKVINATDRFKIFVAVDNGIVTGYSDVTHCFAENEPYDIFVKKEYREKGYGRQLLAMALRENEPKDMMLLVDFDNVLAINLYESMGFVKKENGNLLTAYWHTAETSTNGQLK